MSVCESVENLEPQAQRAQAQVIGRPFEKGNRVNPGGMARGTFSFTRELRRRLTRRKGRLGKRCVQRIINIALKGSDREAMPALNMMYERLEGRTPLTISLEANVRTVATVSQVFDYGGLQAYARALRGSLAPELPMLPAPQESSAESPVKTE